MRSNLFRAVLTMMMAVAPAAATAQAYPVKPVRMIVPFTPGLRISWVAHWDKASPSGWPSRS